MITQVLEQISLSFSELARNLPATGVSVAVALAAYNAVKLLLGFIESDIDELLRMYEQFGPFAVYSLKALNIKEVFSIISSAHIAVVSYRVVKAGGTLPGAGS